MLVSGSVFQRDRIQTLGGGFKCFLCSPLFGEDEPILTIIFFRWVEFQPPTRTLFTSLGGVCLASMFFWKSFELSIAFTNWVGTEHQNSLGIQNSLRVHIGHVG